jgi:hypothetical protein
VIAGIASTVAHDLKLFDPSTDKQLLLEVYLEVDEYSAAILKADLFLQCCYQGRDTSI